MSVASLPVKLGTISRVPSFPVNRRDQNGREFLTRVSS